MTGNLDPAPVTCVITSYNNDRTLHAAINSVVGQTRPVSEILVADDASTDDSQRIIRNYAEGGPVVTPLLRRENMGVAANRDSAIRAARFPFVTHLDGDDLFAPRKIEAEWYVLKGSDVAVAYSYTARVYPGKLWRTRVLNPASTVAGSRDEVLTKLLARRGHIPRDMLMAKALFEKAGGFDHEASLYEDWGFKLRLAAVGAEWRHSGVLGTLYFQRKRTLSSAARREHEKWKRRAIAELMPTMMDELGERVTAGILQNAFDLRGGLREMPSAEEMIDGVWEVKDAKESRQRATARKCTAFRGEIGSRLRAYRYARQIAHTINSVEVDRVSEY